MNIGTNVTGITIPDGAAKNIKRGTEMLWQDGGLPTAFQRCEWLMSNTIRGADGPYINTRKTPKAISKAELTFKFKTNNVYMFLFGGTKGADSLSIYLGNNQTSPTAGITGVGTYSIPYETTNVNTVIFDLKNGNIIYNGTTVLDGETAAFDSGADYPICLFRANRATTDNCGSGYIYAYKYYEDDVLLQYFIPCYLKTEWNGIPAGTIGMYDLCGSLSLNGTPFYINAGTGAFTKGADVL